MSYQKLQEIFKYSITLPEAKLAPVLAVLMAPDSRWPNGSSYAVTVNCDEGNRILWLSESSLKRATAALKEAVL